MNKNIIKFAALVLSLVMALSALAVVAFSADEVVYDGTSVSTSLTGEGTEASPYLIANGADLRQTM